MQPEEGACRIAVDLSPLEEVREGMNPPPEAEGELGLATLEPDRALASASHEGIIPPGGHPHRGNKTRNGSPFKPMSCRRWLFLLSLLLLGGCNPVYVGRAGWAQLQILSARVPLPEMMVAAETDEVTRGKLRFVWDARSFAIEELGFQNAGGSYTSYARLPSDTLALVLTAAHRDRLEFRSWWFPIVGRVPYRAYFSETAGLRAQAEYEAAGFDTDLRPTAAFSTLGWFADPLYSTLLRLDVVSIVESVLHELAHNHLYLPGQGRFNESFANFAGHQAAIAFFCTRQGGGADTQLCQRAQNRWHDALLVSRYMDQLEEELLAFYRGNGEPRMGGPDLAVRDTLYLEALRRFSAEVRPELLEGGYGVFEQAPMNNATFLARSLYYHRLSDFETSWGRWNGDLAGYLGWLREEAPGAADPFSLLMTLPEV